MRPRTVEPNPFITPGPTLNPLLIVPGQGTPEEQVCKLPATPAPEDQVCKGPIPPSVQEPAPAPSAATNAIKKPETKKLHAKSHADAAVRRDQQLLLAAGYDLGPAGDDGVQGKDTRAALLKVRSDFQSKAIGLDDDLRDQLRQHVVDRAKADPNGEPFGPAPEVDDKKLTAAKSRKLGDLYTARLNLQGSIRVLLDTIDDPSTSAAEKNRATNQLVEYASRLALTDAKIKAFAS